MAKTNRKPESTRTDILDAAEEIFLAKGFGAAALSEIARRAGVAKSLIHHYFFSKKNLWQEVKKRRFIPIARRQLELQKNQTPSLELFRTALKIQFEFLENNPQFIRIITWMFLEQDKSEIIDIDRELIQTSIENIRRSQKSLMLRNDIDARFILIAIISLTMYWFQNKDYFVKAFGTEGLPENLNAAYFDAVEKIVYEGIFK